jgi:hypothetical protein
VILRRVIFNCVYIDLINKVISSLHYHIFSSLLGPRKNSGIYLPSREDRDEIRVEIFLLSLLYLEVYRCTVG